MKFNRLLPWLCCAALTVMAACSFAGTTNSPGVIWVPNSYPTDPDATNFIFRAGIAARSPEAKAIGRLVAELKQSGLWTNFDALYPFVGATSNSCAQNLVSTNWAITWNGTNTFLAAGVQGDQVSGWGDTGYLQSSRAALTNDFHMYAWTKINPQSNATGPIIGDSQTGSWGGISLDQFGPTSELEGFAISYNGGGVISGLGGNMITTRTGTNTMVISDVGAATNNIAFLATPTNSVRLLGNMPGSGIAGNLTGYSLATLQAASFGRSLTYQQATNFFAIMRRFEYAAARVAP